MSESKLSDREAALLDALGRLLAETETEPNECSCVLGGEFGPDERCAFCEAREALAAYPEVSE